jgi:hypothetical protein
MLKQPVTRQVSKQPTGTCLCADLLKIDAIESVAHAVYDEKTIKTAALNNCYRLISGKYCVVHELISDGNEVLREVFHRSYKLYDDPCDSRLSRVHKVNLKYSIMKKKLPSCDLDEKAIYIKLDNTSAAVLPLRQTFSM